jgi:tetratricopeptide (TPR) repeat protein
MKRQQTNPDVSTLLARAHSLAKKNRIFDALLIANIAAQKFPSNPRAQATFENLHKKSKKQGSYLKDWTKFANSVNQLFQQNQFFEAKKMMQPAVGLFEEDIPLMHLMGIIEVALGNYFNAEKWFLKIHTFDPKNDSFCLNLANARLQAFQYDKALQSYAKISSASRFYKDAKRGEIVALIALNRCAQANKTVESVNLSEIEIGDLFNQQAQILKKHGKMEAAIELMTLAKSCFRKNTRLCALLASLHHANFNAKQSVKVCLEALKIDENNSHLLNAYGLSLGALGEIEEAQKALLKSINVNNRNCDPYFNLSQISGHCIDDSQIAWMKKLQNDKSLTTKERVKIGFAVFNALDSRGRVDEAWACLQRANLLKKTELKYDVSTDREFFEKILEVSSNWKHPNAGQTTVSDKFMPIFITGMPRSGTTLVEKICCLNEQVQTLGEMSYFLKLAGQYDVGSKPLSAEVLRQLHNGYLDKISKKLGNKKIFTDKQPFNFLYLPLINVLFPNAKLICCVRDPIAVCWSNYKTMFAEELGYSFNLNDTKLYYQLFSNLMSEWQKICGNQLHFVNYERLVVDPVKTVSDLSSFLGLEIDIADFTQKQRDGEVYTASAYQVRKKIYKDSSSDWKRYEKYLQPLFDELAVDADNDEKSKTAVNLG